MSLLCDLPEVLVGSLLVSWVNVEHVGRLDSALCNISQRPTFLKLVNRDNFVFGRPSVCQGRDQEVGLRLFQFQLWLVERDIAVAELAICGSLTHDADKRSRYLQRHGKHIHRVTVGVDAGKLRSCEAAIVDLCVHCPNVTVFECGIPVSSTTTTAIANNWKKLTHITLADNIIGDEHVLIAENCQSLVKLNIWSISWAPDLCRMLHKLFRVCSPKLQSISMGTILEPSHAIAIASRCPLLHNLRRFEVDDAVLVALGSGCPLLSRMDLMYNRLVTDIGLVAFARNGALTDLWVEECDNLSGDGLRTAVQYSPLLQRVDFKNCMATDATLVALGQHCHDLRVLSVYQTPTVSHEGWAAVAAGCPLLEEMNAWDCDDVGLAIEAVARGCPRLRVVVASEAVVRAEAVLALAECCPLLEEVNIVGDDIGDQEIIALARGCPALRELNLIGTAVTSVGLRAVGEHCKKLSEIEFEEGMVSVGENSDDYFAREVKVICY
jgi:hypothetical protein